MKPTVKHFIENHIDILDRDTAKFLYLAVMILNKDADELAQILTQCNVSYEDIVPSVLQRIFKEELSDPHGDRVVVSQYLFDFPRFHLSYQELKNLLYEILPQVNAHTKDVHGITVITWED